MEFSYGFCVEHVCICGFMNLLMVSRYFLEVSCTCSVNLEIENLDVVLFPDLRTGENKDLQIGILLCEAVF